MPLPDFDDLPFSDRPDLTPYLVHLTKNTRAEDDYSAFENLVSILRGGKIWATKKKGHIKGPNGATCFIDVPFAALKYVLTKENTDPARPRYEPYGIFVTKKYAYQKGCRPVLYLSNKEVSQLCIPDAELWRVVRFEVSHKGWISWIHEREWRIKSHFPLPKEVHGVLVKNTNDAVKLQKLIEQDRKSFVTVPKSIIPLTVMCQGFVRA